MPARRATGAVTSQNAPHAVSAPQRAQAPQNARNGSTDGGAKTEPNMKAHIGVQTLLLDGYPTPEQATMLGPNRGSRRWGVAKARTEIHHWVAVAVHLQEIVPVPPPVHVTYRYVVPTRTHRDWDNYALIAKPCQDGLVKAGILIGGDHFEALTASVVFRVERGRRALEIVLEPAAQHAEPAGRGRGR